MVLSGVSAVRSGACLRVVPFLAQSLIISTSVLGIMSHIPWATRWLDQFVDFIGLGLVAFNVANVIVGRRMEMGSMSRDLMFYLVRPILEEGRAVLIICKSNDDGKGVIRRTRPQLVSEGLTAIVAGYVSLDPHSTSTRSRHIAVPTLPP